MEMVIRSDADVRSVCYCLRYGARVLLRPSVILEDGAQGVTHKIRLSDHEELVKLQTAN